MSDILTIKRICDDAGACYLIALRIINGVVSYFHHDCTWGQKRNTLSHKWAFQDELLNAIAKTGLHWVLRHTLKDTWEYDITAPQELSRITIAQAAANLAITQIGEDNDKRKGYPYWQATRSVAVGTRHVLHYFNHPPDNNNTFGPPQDPIQHAWVSLVELEKELIAYLAVRGQFASEASPGIVGDDK